MPIAFNDSAESRSGQIYSSSAWELGRTSVGVKGFDTPEYEAATLNL